MYVCISARISQKRSKTTRQTSRNVLHILPVVVARSSSDNCGIVYVLPVLWMTSCLSIMAHIQGV